MFFGLFKNKKDNDLKELTDKVNKLYKLFNLLEQRIDINIDYYRDLRFDFENLQKKEKKEPKSESKINIATAILDILKNSKYPLDFKSIKDKINEYDLKNIDASNKSIQRSIYNLFYAKKISRITINGKRAYEMRASTAKEK